MSAHALLSASGSKRWLSCPPSARLEAKYPDKSSDAAKEGTLAHAIAEFYLKQYLKYGHTDAVLPATFTENNFYNRAMPDYVFEYVDTCIEKINTAMTVDKNSFIAVEQKISYGDWVPNGFGTGDMVVVSSNYAEIVDLKYGKGVPVTAKDNTQMQMYALGLVSDYYPLYEFEKVKMTIVQPRNGGISTQEKSVDELVKWGSSTVKPTAKLAYKGEGELNAGSWCKFCKASIRCRAYSDYCMHLAQLEFKSIDLLTDDEMAKALSQVDDLITYAHAIKEYALSEALKGKKWRGYKLVEGRSVRKYTDEKVIKERLFMAGYSADMYLTEPKLKSITELTKVIGKKKFDKLLSGFIDKPQGKPTLVLENDPRSEYNPIENEFDVID